MTRFVVLAGSGLFWALMMFALVRREVLPFLAYQSAPTYRTRLKDLVQPELVKAVITAANTQVGTLESLGEPQPDGSFRIRTRMRLKARLPSAREDLGGEIPVRLKSESIVDALYRISRVTSDIDGGLFSATVHGARRREHLDVTYEFRIGGQRLAGGAQTIDFPADAMIGDLFQPFTGGGGLFVGKKWKIPTISPDPTGFRLKSLYAAVTDRENIEWNGAMVATYRVEIRTEPTEEMRPTHIVWCRDDGLAIVQQMTYLSLVYDVRLESRETLTLRNAHFWNRAYERDR
jgi:hypothetical protein